VTPRRICALTAVVLAALAAVAACGGKVDTTSDPGPSATTTAGPSREPPPSPTSVPLAPSAPSVLEAARDIADAYCKTFAGCCRSSGQPPIDVARCRQVTSDAVTRRAGAAPVSSATSSEVAACVAAITRRAAACSREDAAWYLEPQQIFGPASIANACAPLIGKAMDPGEACSPVKPCDAARTCAIDQCTDDVGLDGSCIADGQCFDGLICGSASTCTPSRGAATGSACKSDLECHLGLVCANGKCDSARNHPELYVERHSPYRVGFDTCRVFTFL
jgi:hypothetical protein